MKLTNEIKECVVEYVDVDDVVHVTAYQGKMIHKIEALANEYPDDVKVIAKNENGVIYASLPKRFVHISIGERSKREMTEDQKAAAKERLIKARAKRAEKNG